MPVARPEHNKLNDRFRPHTHAHGRYSCTTSTDPIGLSVSARALGHTGLASSRTSRARTAAATADRLNESFAAALCGRSTAYAAAD